MPDGFNYGDITTQLQALADQVGRPLTQAEVMSAFQSRKAPSLHDILLGRINGILDGFGQGGGPWGDPSGPPVWTGGVGQGGGPWGDPSGPPLGGGQGGGINWQAVPPGQPPWTAPPGWTGGQPIEMGGPGQGWGGQQGGGFAPPFGGAAPWAQAWTGGGTLPAFTGGVGEGAMPFQLPSYQQWSHFLPGEREAIMSVAQATGLPPDAFQQQMRSSWSGWGPFQRPQQMFG